MNPIDITCPECFVDPKQQCNWKDEITGEPTIIFGRFHPMRIEASGGAPIPEKVVEDAVDNLLY